MHFYCVHCSLLKCLLFAHAPAGAGKQARTQGRSSAITRNACARFSREEYAEKLSSEVKHLGKQETGAGKRTMAAHAR